MTNTLQNLIDKIRFSFITDKESYLCFYNILGFYPHHIHFYQQALLHKSSEESLRQGNSFNNERLEFLGDAVLDLIVGDIVYVYYKDKSEGFLTNLRSMIVQRETLNKVAYEIGLDKLIKTKVHSLQHNNYMVGNAFEAFVGAIYLDRGYECCKWFIENKIIALYFDLEKLSKREVNFKSRVIEWGQKNRIEIIFDLIKQKQDRSGNIIFETEVKIGGFSVGKGKGYSKKESQQLASKEALNKIKNKSFQQQINQEKEKFSQQKSVMEKLDNENKI